jgi:hypothetical protein
VTLWRPAIVAGVLMALALLRALSWQVVDHGESGIQLTPHGERLLTVACLAVPIFPALALLWSAITGRLKRRVTITLALMIVFGAVGGFAARFAWDSLFQGHYTASVVSPDGTREAHLFVGGLLGCRGTVYVSERRAIWGTYVMDQSISCDDGTVRWTADGGVELAGSPVEPLRLDWGPH